MRGFRTLYVLAIVAVAAGSGLMFLSPLIMRVTIDSVIGTEPIEAASFGGRIVNWLGGAQSLRHQIWLLALVMLGLTAVQGVFTYLKGRWSAEASEGIARGLRERLYDHIQKLPFSYHAKVETGDLIQRCTSDVETIRRFLATQLVEVGRALFMLALVIPIMLSLSKPMTLISMLCVPFLFAFSVVFFIKVRKAFKAADEAEGAMSATLQENLSGIRVVKAFCRQPFERRKFDAKNADNRNKCYRLLILLAWYWGSSDLLALLQIAAVLIVGALWAAQGKITIGTLVVFMTYEGYLLWPVRQMGRILTDMGKTMVSLERTDEILDVPQEALTEGNDNPPALQGAIEFDHVSFAYDGGEPVLHDVSFSAAPGETIAILGPTGTGKTTLVNLLPRLHDVSGGAIRLDGHDIRSMDRTFLRSQVGIVLQEPFLFSKTLEGNIGLGIADASPEAVHEAAGVACVHDVIEEFDEGYETIVGERGVTLSGGQKQRVAIARAIIQNTPVLVFDDSLSAVDTETDARIRRALKQRKGRATTIIISHRLTTLAQANRILVIEHGRIVEEGTHEELLTHAGLYHRIWDIQSALEKDVQDEMDKEDIPIPEELQAVATSQPA
ncbi:MAG: ABC transporter ATP-binding protein/permease [Candidatus Cloacimonetes bacterium]|nr:ABC transporter ATP-binding protein/permease [Candidatus Cloacimonadota bacterium]